MNRPLPGGTTRPKAAQPTKGQPEMTDAPAPATVIAHFERAESALRDHAEQIQRLIADTLAAMFPGAAYLVLLGDEVDGSIHLHSIVDAGGAVLHDFDDDRPLPALDPLLRTQWGRHDPSDPDQIEFLLRAARDAGAYLGQLPDHLREPRQMRRWSPCLPLPAPGGAQVGPT